MMQRALPSLMCCALLAGCGGGESAPTAPSGATAGRRLSRTRFLAFGDSLTSGEVTVPLTVTPGERTAGLSGPPSYRQILVPAASYPTLLQSQLIATFPLQASTIVVTNAGKPIETAQEGVTRLPTALSESQADVLLLMEGVNGLFIAGPDLSAHFVHTMVQMAKGQTRVFVASMVPTLPGRRNSQVVFELEKLNSNLRSMAAAEGVVFVDLYNPMLPDASTLIGVDGLHPTEAGYRRIADLFLAAIRTELEVK